MTNKLSVRLDRTEKDIAEKILFGRAEQDEIGKTVFFVGAGCSVTAGIPTVKDIAQRMVCEVVSRFDRGKLVADQAYTALVAANKIIDSRDAKDSSKIDWYRVYDQMFQRYYTTPDDVRILFSKIVKEAEGAINWAHLILGEIVARKLVSTVVTTNFDQLVLSGMVRAGVIPVVCDGIESLNRISGQPSHPQLVEIHGSRHTYTLRNAPEDVASVRDNPMATTAIQTLLQHASTFVVVGYGGREDGVMDLLVRAAETFPDKNLFWVAHSNRYEDLSEKAMAFLKTSRNGAALLGRDADKFFFELSKELRIGAPSAIANPLAVFDQWVKTAQLATTQDTDIRNELKRASDQLNFLKECLAAKATKPLADELREKRLAGDLKRAWALVESAMLRQADLFGWTDNDLLEAARVCLDYGDGRPDPRPLQLAVKMIELLSKRTSPDHDQYVQCQFLLGRASQSLGEREAGNARLEQAVTAYRVVLEMTTRERVPLRWATAQNNLGNVLWRLGERESGTARLKEAVEAYRAALAEWTRERVPLDWAMTQNNLGNALQTLGERESGTARLEEAVAAYGAALEERTRERVPLDWAMTQNNLGTALSTLGERTSGTALLEEAVAACRAALEEWTRERVPLDWAGTQNNLGNALRTLGERESGTAQLEEAVAAYRAALEERTRERVPLDWAGTLGELGRTQGLLAERTNGIALAQQALENLKTAIQVSEQGGHEFNARNFTEAAKKIEAILQTLRGERT
jgi:tetratricopeptide (TPR) repeat protein